MTSSADETVQDPNLLELSSEEGNGTHPGTEDSESDESKTESNLCDDLESALQQDKLELPGSYAHASLLPFAPYPCLNIEGLGNLGLPLSETDAKRVIECAARAPYGQGSETIINKEVRDTWEIDPSRVRFGNPNWPSYVQDMTIQTCSALGLRKYDTPPRCEFYKLLIYEIGSHFLPHRDTQKADDMFATMIILLPSQYTGGEIHLTHASKTQVIDFSAFSLANTAVLSWYTDVLHEVKPVTSGYRLALSYNLIHTSPRIPLPVAPTDDGPCGQLRRVLSKWERGGYEQPKNCDYVAYILQHQYSAIDFSRGVSCLKGEDSERVALVRAAAEGLGFVILLAIMKYHISGDLDELGYSWAKRRRGCGNDTSDEDEDVNIDGEVDVSLSKMVDLDGNAVLGSYNSIDISERRFLPRDALDGEKPDDKEEDGYTGNEGSTIDYWYHRSVFVLMLSDQLPRISMQNGGVGYAIELFKHSLSEDAPTKRDKEIAKQIIDNLHSAGNNRVSITRTMFDYACKWKDIEMWQDLIKSIGGGIDVQGENGLVRLWRIFSFDQTRPSIENSLRSKRLPDKLKFVSDIRHAASESDEKDVIQEWCLSQVTVALTDYLTPDLNDVSLLVSLACENGIQSIQQVPIERIDPGRAFHFLTALVKHLLPKRTVVIENTAALCIGRNDPQSEATRMLDDFIRTSLDCASKQWSVATSPYHYSTPANASNQQRLTNVLNMIELCLLARQMDTCSAFLERVWKVSGELVDKFNTMYSPLIPGLCDLLRKTNTDICAPPFIDFFRLLISHCLCYLLGSKGQHIVLARKIGCSFCDDCRELDRFIAGKESTYTFRLVQKRRTHLEYQMDKARDLVTHETHRYGSPHSLVVKKTPSILAASTWEYRLQAVNNMFKAIGGGNVEKIMGDRYLDVCMAIKGQGAFRLDNTVVQQQNVPGPASASTVSVKPTTSIIGEKRKHESEVIVLSDSD